MHKIVDMLSRQTSIKALNNLAISYCTEYLTGSNYRLYLLEKTIDGNIFDVVAHDGNASPNEFEVDLTQEISQTCVYKSQTLIKDDQSYFFVGANRRCFVLVVVQTDEDFKQRQTVLNTIITLWNNQLAILFHFQRDYLTGLFNHEYFVNAINSGNFEQYNDDITMLSAVVMDEQRNAFSLAEQSAILLIDIQGFHRINERYGYSIGDELLILMAHTVETSFRNSDIYCRYSGDVFAVFIHQISEANLHKLIQRFLAKLASNHYPIVDTLKVKIGATFTNDEKLTVEFLSYAEHSLEIAKNDQQDYHLYNQHQDAMGGEQIEIGDIELF